MTKPEPGWDYLPSAVVPFGWRNFARKYRVLFRTEAKSAAVFGQMAARFGLWGALQSSWCLDELFTPGWKRAPMRGPIFIIGHQRSGTTLMHRLLASDWNARALAFHEMLLPSNSFQRTLAAGTNIDARLGGHLTRWFHSRQDALFGPMDSIHRIRFHEIEEDEFVLWSLFASAMCANDAPASVASPDLDELRNFHDWPVGRQQEALGWYRACLLKKAYREPPVRDEIPWIVAKNPAFSQKIPALLKVFPDARFIHLVRNPLETIPSRLSLIRAIWRQRFKNDIAMSREQVATILRDSLRTYTNAYRDLGDLPADRHLSLRYQDLLEDVPGSIHRVYRHFDLPGPSESFHEKLDARAAKKSHTSIHEYSLEEFGLDAASIRSDLREVFDAYEF